LRRGIEGRGNLLGDVENGADATFDEALPVSCVVLGSYPNTWDDLYWTVGVRNAR